MNRPFLEKNDTGLGLNGCIYDEDYFINGQVSGKSLYTNYHWMPDLTIPMVVSIISHCGIEVDHSVLDFGCLVEGSPIITSDGVCNIENLQDDTEVYTHEGQFTKIARRSIRPYSGDIVVMEAKYCQGIPLKLTPDHPVFVVTVNRPFKRWKPEVTSAPFWLPAKDLDRDKHWVVLPRPKRTLNLQIDPDFARLCGYYLAEGFGRKKEKSQYPGTYGYHVCFAFNKIETEYMDDVRDLMQRFFGTTPGWIRKTGDNGATLSFYSKNGYFTLIGLFGQGAHNKLIPSHWINGLSDDAAKQLIVGAYRGDGCKSDSNFRYNYSTVSMSLAVSMRLLLMRLEVMTEIVCGKPRNSNIGGRVIVGKGTHSVRASGEHGLKLAGITGNTIKPVQRTFWHGRMDDDFVYVPIKRLLVEQYDGMVYNMDVQDDHSYAHPACIIHNCARGYTVRAFRELGYSAWGHDISQWALENADESVKEYLITNESTLFTNSFDWIIAKDVLEHVQQVADVITDLMDIARVGVFAVVPLSKFNRDTYEVPEYEKDVTHIHRFTLSTWASLFVRPGWSVTMAYRVLGIKDNYSGYPTGNGFITARRI